YIEQPSGGIRLTNSANGEQGVAAAKMDFRDYGIGAQILSELGLQKIRLLSNTPRNVVALDGYDLEIVEQIGL
ncbi:MAG: bifunctional 3,4-dihydroxy-2-butanone-4-phosphate synthase/GTP cyclohydrolase II, partial [Verrucomicrobiota bacterium]